MTFTTAKLDAAVDAFKNRFSIHPDLIRNGQFYLLQRYSRDLLATIRADLAGQIPFIINPSQIDPALSRFVELIEQLLRLPQSDPMHQTIGQSLAVLANTLIPATAALGAFAFGPPDVAGVTADHATVWNSLDISSPPFLVATVRKLLAARQFEKDNCFKTSTALAKKFQRARSVTSVPPANKISDGQIANASVRRFRDPISGIESDILDVVRSLYVPYEARMKTAINVNAVLRCGILSGMKHDLSVFPTPEHFVLVFDHDVLGGQTVFLFWDPDVDSSNISGNAWGSGFGLLFFTARNLSTAQNDSDLFQVGRTTIPDIAGSFDGYHLLPPGRRHRYQVYSIATLP